ncbi:hypothetical protein [Parasedimentitalea huanghaiensis]|uniref:Uncharacterized protein n=1 Tax=Parasedimentitalea huanghaiensis TaxID=2682100 RepID=A0A6L6WL61_9RHOB|nr:hypothetical protein [Zongyanglinia huanghaiensis]MVO17729.1 hypothetical protein [Zongyanglinia huanghaiensis]
MMKLDWQTVGDIRKNTKSLELWDGDQQHIADVTRYDDTNHLKINTYGNELDVAALEKVIALALTHLGDFEDGTPLSEARMTQEVLP